MCSVHFELRALSFNLKFAIVIYVVTPVMLRYQRLHKTPARQLAQITSLKILGRSTSTRSLQQRWWQQVTL